MLDKTRLGTRYTCYECGTKFYDLNRPTPTCPECGADQSDAPVQDVKALLSKGGGKTRRTKQESEEEAAPSLDEDVEDVDEDGDDDDGFDGIGNDDGDDDDLG